MRAPIRTSLTLLLAAAATLGAAGSASAHGFAPGDRMGGHHGTGFHGMGGHLGDYRHGFGFHGMGDRRHGFDGRHHDMGGRDMGGRDHMGGWNR